MILNQLNALKFQKYDGYCEMILAWALTKTKGDENL